MLPDGRHQYGSGYDTIIGMDLNSGYDAYLVNRLQHVRQTTGIDGFLYDSFYNFGFMPVSYHDMKPRTQARACVSMLAKFAQMGYRMRIESLGPFAQPSHGVGPSYNDDAHEFIRYKGNFSPGHGSDSGSEMDRLQIARKHFRLLSGKSQLSQALFTDGKRLDTAVDPLFARANTAYKQCAPNMAERTLLPEGGAIWHSTDGKTTTVWTFAPLKIKVPAGTKARDVIADETIHARGDGLHLQDYRVYEWSSEKDS